MGWSEGLVAASDVGMSVVTSDGKYVGAAVGELVGVELVGLAVG